MGNLNHSQMASVGTLTTSRSQQTLQVILVFSAHCSVFCQAFLCIQYCPNVFTVRSHFQNNQNCPSDLNDIGPTPIQRQLFTFVHQIQRLQWCQVHLRININLTIVTTKKEICNITENSAKLTKIKHSCSNEKKLIIKNTI